MPTVVIFGRANVGKSTLFNRLIEKNKAMISDIEGTTRDSNIDTVEWRGKKFQLIDTGGILDLKNLSEPLKKLKKNLNKALIKQNTIEEIEAKVQIQAREHLLRADLILFLVDVQSGLLPQDKEMALLLKKNIKDQNKIMLIANKADSPALRKQSAEFNRLAMGEPFPISATSGSGTGDMLDVILKKIKAKSATREKKKTTANKKIKVCIIGKPNVGKSSLLNALLGEEKVIVSPMAHTTREPQDIAIKYKNQEIVLIDTAGISKKAQKALRNKKKKINVLESYGISKSLSTLRKADMALFVLDVEEGLTQQDAKIIEEIIYNQNSLILVANKWDLIKNKETKEYSDYIYSKLPFVKWAPIQFVSAKNKSKVAKIFDLILEVEKQKELELSESQLDKLLKSSIKRHKPVKGKGTKQPYIYKLKQVKVNPPKFELKIGSKDTLLPSYARFIENRIRQKYGFWGTPIGIRVVKNKRVHGQHENKLKSTDK